MQSTDTATLSIDVKLGKATAQIKTLEKEFEKLQALKEKALAEGDTKTFNKTQRALRATQKELDTLRSSTAAWGSAFGDLSGKNERQLRRIRKEMKALLNSGDVQRGSAEWDKYTAALRAAEQELGKIRAEQKAAADDLTTRFAAAAITVRAAFDAAAAAAAKIGGAVERYADFQQHTAAVTKYTGLAKDEVDGLNEAFARMDTATSREKLNDLAADAGRLGLQGKDDILAFVEAADQINLALGEDLGEDAVKNIGKLADIFGDTERVGLKQAMLSTGSAINELAQNSSASEGYILEFTNRLAGVAKQAGLTQAQVMGFASVMDQSGVGVERGATALQNVITALYKNPAKLAAAAGLEVEKFAALLRTDANAALTEFLAALNQKGGFDAVAPALAEMNLSGSGVTQTMTTLAGRLSDVADAQDLANRAFTEGTSCTNEANIANHTAAAELSKVRERLNLVAVSLGEALYPAYISATDGLAKFASVLATVIKWAGTHTASLVALAAAYATFRAAVAWATIVEKAHAAAALVGNAALKARAAMYSLAAAAQALFTGNTAAATTAMQAFNATCKANPWLLLASALLAVGAAVLAFVKDSKQLTAEQQRAAAAAREQATAAENVRTAAERGAQSAAKEEARVRMLSNVLHDNTAALADRRKALATLQQIVPAYHAQLTREGRLINDNTAALEAYVKNLRATAVAQAYTDEYADSVKRQTAAEDELARKQNNVTKARAALAALESGRSKAVKNGGGQAMYSYDKQLDKKRAEVAAQEEAYAAALSKVNTEKRTQSELDKRIAKDSRAVAAATQSATAAASGTASASTAHTPARATTTGGTGGGASSKLKDELAALRKEADKAQAQLHAAYALATIEAAEGETQWSAYRRGLYEADMEYYAKAAAAAQGNAGELARIEKEKAAAVQSRREELAAWSLSDIHRAAEEERQAAEAAYLKGETTATQHEEALSRIQLEEQRKRVQYLKEHGTQTEKEAQALHDEEAKLDRQAAADKQLRETNLQKAIAGIKEKYLQQSAAERYRQELALLSQVEAAELAATTATEEEKLAIQKRYAAARAALQSKYSAKGEASGKTLPPGAADMVSRANAAAGPAATAGEGSALSGLVNASLQLSQTNAASAALRQIYADDTAALNAQLAAREISEEEYNQRIQQMESDYAAASKEINASKWQATANVATSAMGTISAGLSAVSDLVSANASLEEAKITAKYDAEIKAAGENSAEGQRLEEEKQAAISATKKKASKKQAKIEIAQALLDTAMNAIKAYQSMASIPVVGPALGAVAAAAAVAFGMVQVATIKKQHAAQEAAYYSGGYTGGTKYRKEAGVVHEGEFVANHLAVANPAVRPVLDLIDHAQRTGRVAALTPAAIAAAAGGTGESDTAAGTAAAAPAASTATAAALAANAAATDRLSDLLRQGIRASVSMDGTDGVANQLRRYNALNNV